MNPLTVEELRLEIQTSAEYHFDREVSPRFDALIAFLGKDGALTEGLVKAFRDVYILGCLDGSTRTLNILKRRR